MDKTLNKLRLLGYKDIDLIERAYKLGIDIKRFWKPEFINTNRQTMILNILKGIYETEDNAYKIVKQMKNFNTALNFSITEIVCLIEDSYLKSGSKTMFDIDSDIHSICDELITGSVLGWSIRSASINSDSMLLTIKHGKYIKFQSTHKYTSVNVSRNCRIMVSYNQLINSENDRIFDITDNLSRKGRVVIRADKRANKKRV